MIADSPMHTEIPEGFHVEWLHDQSWLVIPEGTPLIQCRRLQKGERCCNAAVAELRRHRRNSKLGTGDWWGYCADHLYGRRVRDGVVECPCLVKDSPEAQ